MSDQSTQNPGGSNVMRPSRARGVYAERKPHGVRRVSCSGDARAVLDHIERLSKGPRDRIPAYVPLGPVYLDPGAYISMDMPRHMTEAEWDQFMKFLKLYRTGLLVDERGRF